MMKKLIIIITESTQSQKMKLLQYSKQRFPGWQICVINVLNKDSNTQFGGNGRHREIKRKINTIEELTQIISSSNLVIGQSNPSIDEILPYIAGKTHSMSFNKCSNIIFDSSSNLLKVSKDIYGSRINMNTHIKELNHTVFISLLNIEFEFEGEIIDEEIEYYTINRDVIFGGNYKIFEKKAPSTKKKDINDASIVVAGGRGIKNNEDFELLKILADKIDGALGASRAIVDEGFIGEEAQVGQTGKTINPDYYIAFGISGTIQHVAGMRNSRTIIAVNKDKDAPIFQFADYGVVLDYKDIVLSLIEKLSTK